MHRVFVVPTPLSSSSKSKSSYKEEEEEEKICCPLFAYFFTACLLTTSFENPKWKMNATPFSVVPTCPLLSKAARRDDAMSRRLALFFVQRGCFCASSLFLCLFVCFVFFFSSSSRRKSARSPQKRERERDARARMLESTQARKFRTKTKRRACFQSSMVDALCRASSPSCSRGVFLSRERPTDAREREGGNEGVFEVFVRVYI